MQLKGVQYFLIFRLYCNGRNAFYGGDRVSLIRRHICAVKLHSQLKHYVALQIFYVKLTTSG